MPNKKLVLYIEKELKTGTPRKKIKKDLVANGWNQDVVEETLSILTDNNDYDDNGQKMQDQKKKRKMDWQIDEEKFQLFFIILLIVLGCLVVAGLIFALVTGDFQTILELVG